MNNQDLAINLEECIKGNRASQKQLYNLFADKMFAICVRYTKNTTDAEDVLQEGFVKLFRNLSNYRGEGSLEGWVRRIFVNTAIEHIRKSKINYLEVSESVHNTLKDKRANGLEKLYEKDIHKATDTLSDGYKTVFNLYAVDGFTHKEIAEQLGITESTSKSQFSRAKATLRNLLKPGKNNLAAS